MKFEHKNAQRRYFLKSRDVPVFRKSFAFSCFVFFYFCCTVKVEKLMKDGFNIQKSFDFWILGPYQKN